MVQENLSPYHIVLIVSGTITCFLSSLVILTNLLFKSMRVKFFMHIIMMISACDFFGNLAQFYPMDQRLCTLHGIWYFTFFGASYIWTVFLSYLLYGLAKEGKVLMRRSTMHISAVILATIRGVLPYSTSVYVTSGLFCAIESRDGFSPAWAIFWNVLVFPVWIGLTFFIIVALRFKIYQAIKSGEVTMTPTVRIAIDTMQLYPLILIVCWTPRYISDVVSIAGCSVFRDDIVVETFIRTLTTLHGAFVAILFFWKSPEARKLWYKTLSRVTKRLQSRQIGIFGDISRNTGLSMKRSDMHGDMLPPASMIGDKDGLVFSSSVININDLYDLSSNDSDPSFRAVGTPTHSPHTSTSLTSRDLAIIQAAYAGMQSPKRESIGKLSFGISSSPMHDLP